MRMKQLPRCKLYLCLYILIAACQTYLQDSLAHFLIQMCQRHNTVEGNASSLLLFEVDVGRVSVEADANRL